MNRLRRSHLRPAKPRRGLALGWWVIAGVLISAAGLGAWWWGLNTWAAEVDTYDKVRTAITGLGVITVGGGAAIAFRRQTTLERQSTLDHSKERRATYTDLHARYQQAAGQLGHERAMIRIAGVYALEALADEWGALGEKAQRDVCIDLLCGYLRSSPETNFEDHDGLPQAVMADDEADVRRAITTVIARHLRDRDDGRAQGEWSNHDYDLTGATFASRTSFQGVHFAGKSVFAEATFIGSANFHLASFHQRAVFDEVTFSGDSRFDWANFHDVTGFDGATFSGHTEFNLANFHQGAWFEHATFSGHASFSGTNFHDEAMFAEATFSGHTEFRDAVFAGSIDFDGTVVPGTKPFAGARVPSRYLTAELLELGAVPDAADAPAAAAP